LTGIVDIFDPTTESFQPVSHALSSLRCGHSATLFNDDTVFIAGGGTDRAEFVDASGGGFSLLPAHLVSVRTGHAAITLPDGRILLVGGDAPATVEAYDNGTGTFSPAGTIGSPTSSATLLANGRILALGGESAAVYVPASGELEPLLAAESLQRTGHNASELPSSK